MQVSLQALKAFESAARRGSFKLAAEELSLTPTAISHHISNLESRLNLSLFHRQGRRISLTATGERLARATSEGFRKIDNALEEVMKAGSVVRVTTTSSLAAMVLIPAQHQFEESYPGISLEISTGESVDSQPFTIPIRYGDVSAVKGADIIRSDEFNVFGPSGMTPPSWADGPITIFTTEWKNKALPAPPLVSWMKKNGVEHSRIKLRKFDQELFGIQQALAEHGLVFCSTTLAKGLIKSNLLRQFETQTVNSNLGYYVPDKQSFETRTAIRFLAWIEDILTT